MADVELEVPQDEPEKPQTPGESLIFTCSLLRKTCCHDNGAALVFFSQPLLLELSSCYTGKDNSKA